MSEQKLKQILETVRGQDPEYNGWSTYLQEQNTFEVIKEALQAAIDRKFPRIELEQSGFQPSTAIFDGYSELGWYSETVLEANFGGDKMYVFSGNHGGFLVTTLFQCAKGTEEYNELLSLIRELTIKAYRL